MGDCHARFLGEGREATLEPYPISRKLDTERDTENSYRSLGGKNCSTRISLKLDTEGDTENIGCCSDGKDCSTRISSKLDTERDTENSYRSLGGKGCSTRISRNLDIEGDTKNACSFLGGKNCSFCAWEWKAIWSRKVLHCYPHSAQLGVAWQSRSRWIKFFVVSLIFSENLFIKNFIDIVGRHCLNGVAIAIEPKLYTKK